MKGDGLIRTAVVVAFFLVLEILCRLGTIDRLTMVPPTEMGVAFVDVFRNPVLLGHVVSSLLNIAAAMALTIAVGFVLGVAIHAAPRVRRTLDPLLSAYYALPLFAFYPLFIVVFGIGHLAIISMGFVTGLAAMVLSTINGIDNIPPVLDKVARTYRMGPVGTALKLKLPAAAPYLVTGVQLSIAYGFIGVIASEFILSGAGLGYAIGFAYNAFDTRGMYGLILLVLILTGLLNAAIYLWDKRLDTRRRRL